MLDPSSLQFPSTLKCRMRACFEDFTCPGSGTLSRVLQVYDIWDLGDGRKTGSFDIRVGLKVLHSASENRHEYETVWLVAVVV